MLAITYLLSSGRSLLRVIASPVNRNTDIVRRDVLPFRKNQEKPGQEKPANSLTAYLLQQIQRLTFDSCGGRLGEKQSSLTSVIYLGCGGKLRGSGRPPFFPNSGPPRIRNSVTADGFPAPSYSVSRQNCMYSLFTP